MADALFNVLFNVRGIIVAAGLLLQE